MKKDYFQKVNKFHKEGKNVEKKNKNASQKSKIFNYRKPKIFYYK